ncbi:MAG: hypothetical protein GKR94_23720 [Gammaproteobacteria bacterium]|nr:hypothetical protein [Gammaproteobacteria bacterium]
MADNEHWLVDFSSSAAKTDTLLNESDHLSLLLVGLTGEAGSVLTELKKQRRELEAYPHYRNRLVEELGDFLWYFVRVCETFEPRSICRLQASVCLSEHSDAALVDLALQFSAAVTKLAESIRVNSLSREQYDQAVSQVWYRLQRIALTTRIELSHAAESNREKTVSRWPQSVVYRTLFDRTAVRRSNCLDV